MTAGTGTVWPVPYEFPVAEPCPACEWLAGRQAWAPVIQTPLAASYVSSRQRTHGTVCVIPKRHVCHLTACTDDEVADMARILRWIVQGIERAYAPASLHAWLSTATLASQHRPHAHINVVPRYSGQPYSFEPSFGMPTVPIPDREEIARAILTGLDGQGWPGDRP